mmetsp:Transcript_23948/g.38575  ORF Transcript_23948/g.38575 Transcript_23948/m.38575 type:complete len:478 (+) Transcript_23948:204-1637(+)
MPAEDSQNKHDETAMLVVPSGNFKQMKKNGNPITPGHIVAIDAHGPRIDNKLPDVLPYDGKSLRRAAGYVVFIGLVSMVAVFIMEWNNERIGARIDSALGRTTGGVATLGALFLFGSVGLMFKEPPDEFGTPDAVLFQAFNALGIFIVGVPLMLYMVYTHDDFEKEKLNHETWYSWFEWLGIVGAIDIIIVSFWASLSTQLVGYAMAPSILNGVGMVTSFIWGKTFFAEPVKSFVGASFSLAILILGVCLLAATHIASELEGMKKHNFRKLRDRGRQHTSIDIQAIRPTNKPGIPRAAAAAFGFFAGVMAGVFDGALMVPYKLHVDLVEEPEASSLRFTVAYLASFSFASLLTAPFLLLFAYVREHLQGEVLPDQHGNAGDLRAPNDRFMRKLCRAVIPGGITGTIWAMGNFLSVHATKHLGMSIGFPLVQTGILVAAVWGVVFFQDINVSRPAVGALFACALISLIIGAAMLAQMG